ncbi:hypothetical protein JAAARDRAFT_145309 [Jaapia argillacea MUCL 33604]|uniref:JmjC domain-containing protein n=1 Tax=Jaapia argillacea MUCL 33604 TaxID=933084 RepID=A0A067QC44_9AGAM|nr:hypothetical protein JAAARDRAFT_145309 [Jaapia argillacea MUCL 33604]
MAEAHWETLLRISEEYHDLNGSAFQVLHTPPSALEFSRLVHISRPVLIKEFHVPAHSAWTNEYLIHQMGDRNVSVAVTPNGRADAIAADEQGKLYFVEPHVQQMTMAELLSKLSSSWVRPSEASGEAFYLQSQNGNMYTGNELEPGNEACPSEFEPLRKDVPSEIDWCCEAMGKHPDAVNLWIGDSKSTTSIHSDPYENIYTVIRGAKHFTLLPPTDGCFMEERSYSHATYARDSPSSPLTILPSPNPTPPVRWSSISDPHLPNNLPSVAHPIHITVEAGEALYLPAGWWHHVRQSGDITIALNWWYDIEMRGMTWVWLSFLRGIGDEVPAANWQEDDNDAET